MLFTLEAINAGHGDALLLHYGDPDDPSLLMIDTLHCLFLGVVPRFLEAAIWLCIVSNVWQVDATHSHPRPALHPTLQS